MTEHTHTHTHTIFLLPGLGTSSGNFVSSQDQSDTPHSHPTPLEILALWDISSRKWTFIFWPISQAIEHSWESGTLFKFWGVACLVKHPLEENRPQFPAPFQATADLTIVNSKLCPLFSEQHTLVRLKHLENCSPFGGWEGHLTHQGQ